MKQTYTKSKTTLDDLENFCKMLMYKTSVMQKRVYIAENMYDAEK